MLSSLQGRSRLLKASTKMKKDNQTGNRLKIKYKQIGNYQYDIKKLRRDNRLSFSYPKNNNKDSCNHI